MNRIRTNGLRSAKQTPPPAITAYPLVLAILARRRLFPTGMVSVKETDSKASETLTWVGHDITILADQALAGLMKPNLVSALIQRGALR